MIVHLQNDGPPGEVDEPGQPGWELFFPANTSSLTEFVIRKTLDDGFDGTTLGEILSRHRVIASTVLSSAGSCPRCV